MFENRERLVERIARAMFYAEPPTNPHGPDSDLAYNTPSTREHTKTMRRLAEVALEVVETAQARAEREEGAA